MLVNSWVSWLSCTSQFWMLLPIWFFESFPVIIVTLWHYNLSLKSWKKIKNKKKSSVGLIFFPIKQHLSFHCYSSSCIFFYVLIYNAVIFLKKYIYVPQSNLSPFNWFELSGLWNIKNRLWIGPVQRTHFLQINLHHLYLFLMLILIFSWRKHRI